MGRQGLGGRVLSADGPEPGDACPRGPTLPGWPQGSLLCRQTPSADCAKSFITAHRNESPLPPPTPTHNTVHRTQRFHVLPGSVNTHFCPAPQTVLAARRCSHRLAHTLISLAVSSPQLAESPSCCCLSHAPNTPPPRGQTESPAWRTLPSRGRRQASDAPGSRAVRRNQEHRSGTREEVDSRTFSGVFREGSPGRRH